VPLTSLGGLTAQGHFVLTARHEITLTVIAFRLLTRAAPKAVRSRDRQGAGAQGVSLFRDGP